MQTKDDISYGVIPLFYEAGVWYVFLIHQYGHAGDVYWTFPKGHGEEGESVEESARRELKEETNLEVGELDTSKVYTQEYSFPYKDITVNKKVLYYKGIVTSKEYLIQEDEVQDAGWFTFEEASKKVTHDRARALLAEIEGDISVLP